MIDTPIPPGASRVTFTAMPDEPERKVWVEWLRRHGIDEQNVPVPGWIDRIPDAYQVRYLSYRRNERHELYVDENGEAAQTVLTVQLEGPPLPFPASLSYPEIEKSETS